MIKNYCDRCNEEIPNKVSVVYIVMNSNTTDARVFDVCAECASAVYLVLHGTRLAT